MDQEQLAEIVKEIEEEQALNRTSAVQVFRSALNQPELVSLSSANATANGASYGYSQFDVSMPRPIYEADTLQLLTANIPLCTQNIPDTACVFWYYIGSVCQHCSKYGEPVFCETAAVVLQTRVLPTHAFQIRTEHYV